MNGRRLVVHIGVEKTGTKSIQKVLSENRHQLIKNNILYPRIFGKSNHTYLSSACMDDDVYDNLKAHILASENWTVSELRDRMEAGFGAELNAHENIRHVLVSTEIIHSRLIRPSETKRLMDMFRKYVSKIEIVVFIRRQDHLATSRFSTALRAGITEFDNVFGNLSPQQYFHLPVGKEPDDFIDYYDYRKMIERFIPHVGMENIKVGLYEKSSVSAVQQFLKLASINPSGLAVSEMQLNSAMGVESQILISELNKVTPTVLESGIRNKKYQKFRRSIEARYVSKARMYLKDDAINFFGMFTESNEWVRKNFFAEKKDLFDSDFSQYADRVDYEDLKERLLPEIQKLKREYQEQSMNSPFISNIVKGHYLSLKKKSFSSNDTNLYAKYIHNIIHLIKWKRAVYKNKIVNKLTIIGQAVQPTFALFRILGNDHWPRHSETQSIDNLKKILDEEHKFEDCAKIFVVNRIIDGLREAELINCLKENNVKYYSIPFKLNDYASCEYDYAAFGGREFFTSDNFKKLSTPRQIAAAIFVCRRKIAYAMHVNGARNASIKWGNEIADWTFPWDGSCALNQASFKAIQESCRKMPKLPLRIVPMARMLSNDTDIEEFEPSATTEEPQILISRNCTDCFDENWPYGFRDKTEFLQRAGVPGPWHYWPRYPWLPSHNASDNIDGQFDYVNGYAIRLASGQNRLDETVKNTPRFRARNAAILSTIKSLEVSLSREVPEFLELADRPDYIE